MSTLAPERYTAEFNMGRRNGRVVKRLDYWPHTSSVRILVPSGTEKNPSECMRFGCPLPIAVLSQAYPGNAEMCPGFPPPDAALVTAAAGDKALGSMVQQ